MTGTVLEKLELFASNWCKNNCFFAGSKQRGQFPVNNLNYAEIIKAFSIPEKGIFEINCIDIKEEIV
jgi:hypothetical protein